MHLCKYAAYCVSAPDSVIRRINWLAPAVVLFALCCASKLQAAQAERAIMVREAYIYLSPDDT